MNNFGDKVKHFFGLEIQETEEPVEEPREVRVERRRDEPDPVAEEPRGWEPPRERKPVSTKSVYADRPAPTSEAKVVICKYSPLDHRESTMIIDDIRSGRPVILNFEDTDDFVAAKIINICEGAAYALDADISKIANEIFIVVPQGIDILNNMAKPTTREEVSF